jgi:hypothetical protein
VQQPTETATGAWFADRATIAASVLVVVSCAVAYGGLFSHAYPGDVNLYASYGRLVVEHGQYPYKDFTVYYPPGAIPVFVLPALLWNAHYVLVFKLLMTACALGFTLCSAWIVRHLRLSPLRLAPVVLAPLLMGPVFLNRYDPVPALLGSLALVALLRGQERASAALLGAGTAVKLYSAVFVPAAARRASSLLRAGAWYVIGGAVLCLPFVLVAPGGVGYSLSLQVKRHLQIESLGASFLLVVSKLGIHHVGWIRGRPGSIDLGGSTADAVGVVTTLLSLAAVGAVAWAFWRGPDEDERMVTAWAGSVTAFVLLGKVLSPQYLTWLVPLVPLAAGRRGRNAAILFVVALGLTQFENLADRWGLRHQDWMVWVLLLRNLVLVAIFGLLVAQLLEARRPIAKGS